MTRSRAPQIKGEKPKAFYLLRLSGFRHINLPINFYYRERQWAFRNVHRKTMVHCKKLPEIDFYQIQVPCA